MKKLIFFDDSQVIDPAVTPRVTKIDLRPYQINIYLTNLLDRGYRSLNLTKGFFNVSKLSIAHDEGTQQLKISLPRIQAPTKSFKAHSALVLGSSGYGKSSFFIFLLAGHELYHRSEDG